MIRVGIFMGGASLEKEVSFNSGRTICDYIDRYFYIPIPIFITTKQELFILPWQFLYRGKISDFEDRLYTEATRISWDQLETYIDFAYLALHGTYGENGSIQGLLEILKIPYSGSSILTNAICINKSFTSNLLRLNGILTPPETNIKKNDLEYHKEAYKFLEQHDNIIIVKPVYEGSSIGISIAQTKEETIAGIEKARHINNDPQDVILQKYIFGSEFSVIAIQKKSQWIVFQPTEILSNKQFFTYNEKYLPGSISKYTPGRFSDQIKKLITDTVLHIISIINPYDVIRVDGIINKNNEIVIIDINTFPGTAPSSFVFLQSSLSGLSPVDFTNTIIENSLQRYNKNENKHIYNKINVTIENKIKVAVLLGGASNEKEISLESGRNIFYKLSPLYYEPKALFVSSTNKFYELSLSQIVKDTTHEIENSLTEEQEILFSDFKKLFDFVFLGLHGGEGEDGTIQKKLEEINMPYNGSNSTTSKLCMNKNQTLSILEKNSIKTTNRILFNRNTNLTKIYDLLEEKYKEIKKLIVKPNNDGCSALVNFANTTEQALSHIKKIFSHNKDECLVEEYVEGIELTVGILGNQENFKVLSITQTTKSETVLSIEEKFLPGAGENITPAQLNFEDTNYIQEEIKKTYQILECDGYARIDCFWIPEKKELIILECNTLPAMTPATCFFHQAAEIGINPAEVISYIIYLGFLKHDKNNKNILKIKEIIKNNTILIKS